MSILVLQQMISSLYKRKGKDVVSARDLELLASMELRWFDPNDARKILERAISLGLLQDSGDGLKTTFDHTSVELPLGFRPPKNLLDTLEDESESIFMQLVNQISMTTSQKPEDIIADINQKQANTEGYLTLEVLAILYGKSKGVDVDRFVPMVKSKLLSNSD